MQPDDEVMQKKPSTFTKEQCSKSIGKDGNNIGT